MDQKKDKLKIVQQLLASAKNSIQSADQMIKKIIGTSSGAASVIDQKADDLSFLNDGKVIEGVFDGINMIGPDQKEYKVPDNYASKSKLIEGDGLKLTIGEDGGFIFKQIKPAPRKKIVGTLVEEGGNYKVLADGKSYKLLSASVTFHKASDNDQVTVVVPEDGNASWAAFENVVGPTAPTTVPQETAPSVNDLGDMNEVEETKEEKVSEVSPGAESSSVLYPTPETKETETVKAEESDEPSEGVKELEI